MRIADPARRGKSTLTPVSPSDEFPTLMVTQYPPQPASQGAKPGNEALHKNWETSIWIPKPDVDTFVCTTYLLRI